MAKTRYHCPSCKVSPEATAVVGWMRCPKCCAVLRVAGAEIEVSGQSAEEVLSVADGLIESLLNRKPAVAPVADLRSPDTSHRIAPEVRVDKIKVLLFAANPRGTDPLDLNREFREIDQEIRFGEYRDALELIIVPGTRLVDLLRKLNEDHPNIVHFSGHGNIDEEIILESGQGDVAGPESKRSSPARDMRRSEPKDDAGRACSPRPLAKSALVDVLMACNEENIRVVVLNACHTRPQAEAISEVIDCVISMNREISDVGAIRFAASFYGALAFGRSVKKAFEQGLARLKAEGVPEAESPRLLVRTGVDASKLFVVGPRGNAEAIKISEASLTAPLPQNGNLVGREGVLRRLRANLKPQHVMFLGLAFAVVAVALTVSSWLFWPPKAKQDLESIPVNRTKDFEKTKQDLEIISVNKTEHFELDLTLRNIGNEPAVIHQIDLTIVEDGAAFLGVIKPSAKYSIPMGSAKVGETRSLTVSHYVKPHDVDRFKLALQTTRDMSLRLTLHYNKGQTVEHMYHNELSRVLHDKLQQRPDGKTDVSHP